MPLWYHYPSKLLAAFLCWVTAKCFYDLNDDHMSY